MTSMTWKPLCAVVLGLALCQTNLYSQSYDQPSDNPSPTPALNTEIGFRVTTSDGNPAARAQFYETGQEVVLTNAASSDQFKFPNELEDVSQKFLSRVTDQSGVATKLFGTAMFIVSESEDEIAFLPPRSNPGAIQLRKCGKLRIDTSPLDGTNTGLHVLVVWKNCLAGHYPTSEALGDNWMFKPYFTVMSVKQVLPSSKSVEIMLPPGEVAVSAISDEQMKFFETKFRDSLEPIRLAHHFPATMGIHQIHSGKTTSAPIQLGWCVSGQVKSQKALSPLPNWSGSEEDHDFARMTVSSSKRPKVLLDALKFASLRSKDIVKTARTIADRYSTALNSEEGRKLRSEQFADVPVFVDSEGNFATIPLPAGNIRFRLTRIDEVKGTRGNTVSVRSRWLQSFYTRRKSGDANTLEVEVDKLTEFDSIQGALGRKDIGNIVADVAPFNSEKLPTPKPSSDLTDYSNSQREASDAPAVQSPPKKATVSDPPMGSTEAPGPDSALKSNVVPRSDQLERISVKQLERLMTLVSDEFDQRIADREKELNELNSMIESARKRLKRRQANRAAIIQRRIHDILSVEGQLDVETLWKAHRKLELKESKGPVDR